MPHGAVSALHCLCHTAPGLKVCLGQINTTPGDFSGNLARILDGIERAAIAQSAIVVFPELTIPGYLSQDLLYNPDFIDANLATLQQVVSHSGAVSPDLHIVLGYIGRSEGPGKPFTNMACVIRGGAIVAQYQKQLLPFYDVFDELRYFEPGHGICCFNVGSTRVGLAICEDLWNDKGADDYNYDNNPLEQYRDAGVDLVLSLNSSPYVQGKMAQRLEHIVPATKAGMTIVYVNQTGGQDELVFDGQSFIARDGKMLHVAGELFEDSFDIVDLADPINENSQGILQLPVVQPPTLKDLLVLGLRDYVRKSGFEQVVLASSGGVDSAVVCMLACEALGPANVHAIRMPSVFSSDHSKQDAVALHAALGCHDYEVPIEHESLVASLNERFVADSKTDGLVARRHQLGDYNKVADENIQARLRDVYLMHFSNAYGAMPLSTGNKTESACGYYTHFDMNFSYAPIKDLYKFEVVALARQNPAIPEHIWVKPPSAELAAGQTDEASLMPYAVLDPIIKAYVEDYVSTMDRFRTWTAIDDHLATSTADPQVVEAWLTQKQAPQEYERIISLIGRMEYKRRQTCPGTKVSKVAFGIGRRIPIVEKWS